MHAVLFRLVENYATVGKLLNMEKYSFLKINMTCFGTTFKFMSLPNMQSINELHTVK